VSDQSVPKKSMMQIILNFDVTVTLMGCDTQLFKDPAMDDPVRIS